MTTTLRSERVTLRPLADDDIAPLNAIVAAPGVREIWGEDPTIDDAGRVHDHRRR